MTLSKLIMYLLFLLGIISFFFASAARYSLVQFYPSQLPTPGVLLNLSSFFITLAIFVGVIVIINKKK